MHRAARPVVGNRTLIACCTALSLAQRARIACCSRIGEEGAAGRIDVIATALQTRMRVDEFEQLDLAYSPPFAPVWDPILIAAQQLVKELA